jgi:hypothetical protein
MHLKSNAEKVEKYLYRCSMDPVLKSSTLLRDFFSPQRDGDSKSLTSAKDKQQLQKSHDNNMNVAEAYPSPTQSYDQTAPTPNDDISDHNSTNDVDSRSIDIGTVWVPSPHPSIVSLPLSRRTSKSHSIHSSISKISHHSYSNSNNNSIHRYSNSHHSYSHHSLIDDIEYEEDDDLIHIMARNDGKQQQENFEYDFPLDHLEMVKVLGKGCMGKVKLYP